MELAYNFGINQNKVWISKLAYHPSICRHRINRGKMIVANSIEDAISKLEKKLDLSNQVICVTHYYGDIILPFEACTFCVKCGRIECNNSPILHKD